MNSFVLEAVTNRSCCYVVGSDWMDGLVQPSAMLTV